MGGARSSLRPSTRQQAPSSATENRVELRLLNAFELVVEGVPVPLPMAAQRLVAFVALHERSLQREYVAGSLWLDTSDDRAGANLRSTLWRIHTRSSGVIDAGEGRLRLGANVRVDLRDAERLARLELDGSAAGDDLVEPTPLAGDLLPDWYDDWVLLERERFRQLRLRALDARCERLLHAGRLAEALDAGLLSVAGEPLRESPHRVLVRVHLAEGNAVEAIRQYRLCCRLLREHLGIGPSAQLRELLAGLDGMETER